MSASNESVAPSCFTPGVTLWSMVLRSSFTAERLRLPGTAAILADLYLRGGDVNKSGLSSNDEIVDVPSCIGLIVVKVVWGSLQRELLTAFERSERRPLRPFPTSETKWHSMVTDLCAENHIFLSRKTASKLSSHRVVINMILWIKFFTQLNSSFLWLPLQSPQWTVHLTDEKLYIFDLL